MKNIYETDGLSRENRAERVAMDFPLHILEEHLPVLLNRVLRKSKEFARLYHYQPIVVLSEIEHIDTDAIQEVFYFLQDEEEKVYYIRTLLLLMEGWRKRLEAFSLYSGSLELLRDLEGQIEANLAPWFPHFVSLYQVEFEPGQMGSIWKPLIPRSKDDVLVDGFFRRFFYLFLASVTVLHRKTRFYKEEIYATGTMDASLGVLISFLKNYGEIVSGFNLKWKELPLFYYREILHIQPRPEIKGKTWLSFEKKPAILDFIIPSGSYFPVKENVEFSGYRLMDNLRINNLRVENISFVITERNKERYPEAALNYITSLLRTDFPENIQTRLDIGIVMKSDVFLMSEGTREVIIHCCFTDESLAYLRSIVSDIAREQQIGTDEARLKMVADAFTIDISTAEGWKPVQHLIINCNLQSGMVFCFKLDNTFPAVIPFQNEEKPSIRLLMNPGSWLFAYSWARRMLIQKIHIQVDVSGIRSMNMYNELGVIDTNQPFSPFGVLGQCGSWFVFGNYEIICKRAGKIGLSFHWQHIPDATGGLEYYYKEYRKGINNRSFRVRTQYLQNNEWKSTTSGEFQYIFRTQGVDDPIPEPDGKLSDEASLSFNLPEIDDFGIRRADDFVFGYAHSGFFRVMLVAPDMGFGEKEYRRIFTETMVYNSRHRRKLQLPQEPVVPVMDAPRLSYSAEEICYFAIGQPASIEITYIRPLSDRVDITADTTRPIPLAEGPDDEGNLLIGFSGAVGENIFTFYIDTQPLQKQHICTTGCCTSWYFKNVLRWERINPSYVLTDNTGNLRHSGKVQIQLPIPVSQQMLDVEGLFWICLAVNSGLENCATVKNIYTQVAEAEVVNEVQKATVFPGLEDYSQISQVTDARPPETPREMSIRLRERISHRNRALLPRDYEQLILQEFPQIQKVKCLPGIDAANDLKYAGAVTIALVNARIDNEWPLCEDKLLNEVQAFIECKASPFARLHIVNPLYEEVTVFCGISLRRGCSTGTTVTEIRRSIRRCIAPWADSGELPVFGHSFSVNDLQSMIVENRGVEQLHGIKVIHQKENRTGDLFTNEYIPGRDDSFRIMPSEPWGISVPADNQYIIVCTPQEWRETVEYGDLELGRTFVIE